MCKAVNRGMVQLVKSQYKPDSYIHSLSSTTQYINKYNKVFSKPGNRVFISFKNTLSFLPQTHSSLLEASRV